MAKCELFVYTMSPKIKVTKEDIINTALQLVRESGAGSINARGVASALSCSTQPVFSNFATMDELRMAVITRATEICNDYIKREVDRGEFPTFKASGIAYIRFAKEEKELFKLLFMRNRAGETVPEKDELGDWTQSVIQSSTGLDGDEVKLFHLEMWAYVHGIASMLATGFIDLDWELISRMLTDAYQGLRKQYVKEEM